MMRLLAVQEHLVCFECHSFLQCAFAPSLRPLPLAIDGKYMKWGGKYLR